MLVMTHELLSNLRGIFSADKTNTNLCPYGERLHFIGTHVDTEHALAIDVVYDTWPNTDMHWMLACSTARVCELGQSDWVPPYLFRAVEQGYGAFLPQSLSKEVRGELVELEGFLGQIQLPLSIGGLTEQPKNLIPARRWQAEQCAYIAGVIRWARDQDTFKRLGVSHKD